jgi:hypothetical protein
MIQNTHSYVSGNFVIITIGFYSDDYVLISEQTRKYPIRRKKSSDEIPYKKPYLGVNYDEFGNEAGW